MARPLAVRILLRSILCIAITVLCLGAFYLSLIASSRPLTIDQKSEVRQAAALLSERGFETDALLLRSIAVYRGTDNWLNSSVAKENAYAATNFPFEVVTLYSDFFTYPVDKTERAAILLHEARHLRGDDERDAYAYVWQNRHRLGWTRDRYFDSPVWQNVRRQTRDAAPEIFNCPDKDLADCTE